MGTARCKAKARDSTDAGIDTEQRLRALSGERMCNNEQPWTKILAYGHRFQSCCLTARRKSV